MLSTSELNESTNLLSSSSGQFTSNENQALINNHTTNNSSLVPTLENAVNNLAINSNNQNTTDQVLTLNEKINLSLANNLLNNNLNNLHNTSSNSNNNLANNLLATPNEQPSHYNYLKEFRVEQCPLFVQHKCTQHKPFTCFNWHFLNQRRRRPIRKKDGTFNYSPDNYCTNYDETTGICTDGDECVLLHRTAGDTERRYHLRYYKTGNCVYETDSRGFCVKNGPHCAFAHGPSDLRNPIYDIHEMTLHNSNFEDQENNTNMVNGGFSSLDKDRNAVNEDPRWQDTSFVLSNYKTEFCKKPPRLCRQGYACPQFHNTKDRRRTPKLYNYRSTPCPNVKQGDEWGDPSHCESGDSCHYCHTRTEQQFHPEIYKSTKCNDVQQTSYCPRGPFCAFAHNEQEMNAERELSLDTCSDLTAIFSSNPTNDKTGLLNTSNNSNNSNNGISILSRGSNYANSNNQINHISQLASSNSINIIGNSNSSANSFMPSSVPSHFGFPEFVGLGSQTLGFQRENTPPIINNTNNLNNTLGPIARPRSYSSSHTSNLHHTLNSINRETLLNSFFKMNNSIDEKSSRINSLSNQQQQQAIQPIRKVSTTGSFFSNNAKTDSCGLFSNQQYTSTLQTNLVNNASNNSLGTNLKNGSSNNFFGHNLDTVESVVESALDDLTLDELGSIEKDLANRNLPNNTFQEEHRNLSGNNSVNVNRSPNNFLTGSTVPVNVPGANQRSDLTNISSPTVGFAQSPFSRTSLNQNISLSVGSSLYDFATHSNISPTNQQQQQQINILQQQQQSQAMLIEIQRLREELAISKTKGMKAEEDLHLVRQACEFWKNEAEKAHLEKKNIEKRCRKD